MAERELTSVEKQEILNDLLYDYGMVLGTVLPAIRLPDGRLIPRLRDSLDKNAIRIESFAMRWRSLMDFFYGHEKSKTHSDDVLACDFVPEWDELAPEKYAEYAHDRDRVNKQIAHIGLKRILQRTKSGTGKDEPLNVKSWSHERMVELAVSCMRAFYNEMHEELRSARNASWALHWEREFVAQEGRMKLPMISDEANE